MDGYEPRDKQTPRYLRFLGIGKSLLQVSHHHEKILKVQVSSTAGIVFVDNILSTSQVELEAEMFL